jgi:hypothetical protein
MIKPNYEDSITNLACSIRKYFGLSIRHNGIKEIDELLNEKRPRNVVVILYDGLGFNIMNRHLDKGSFLVTNCLRDYSSVVPCTTTASTTSMLTGMNPCEHGWLGWDLFIKPEDKIVTMFTNKLKDTSIDAGNYNVARKYYSFKSITEEINDNGEYSSKILFPFGEGAYYGLKDMHNRIISECKKDGMHYIYAYYEDPDGIMHELGTDHLKTNRVINKIDKLTEELCSKLDDDTLVIVTADHGHFNSESILLSDYADLYNTLDGDVWIEGRMCAFKVKEGMHDTFVDLFNKYFGREFVLKSKKEILDEKLFGTGVEHILFRDSLGDYFGLAISNKFFKYSVHSVDLRSMHAGFTEDEMRIPLIVVVK